MDKSLKGNSNVAEMIWFIGSPIVFTIGVLGNAMTIAVLSRKHCRKTSTNVFLTGMAFSDLIVMLNTLPRWWLIYVFDVDIRLLSDFSCKMHWFLCYVGGMVSGLIISALTIERIISTVRPHKVRTICTTKTACTVTSLIFLTTAVLCCHIFYGFKLVPLSENGEESINEFELEFQNQNSTAIIDIENVTMSNNITANKDTLAQTENEKFDGKMCDWNSNKYYGQFYITSFQIIVVVYNLVIPQVILVLGGLVIVRKLAISARSRKQMTHREESMDPISKVNKLDTQSTQITKTLMLVNFTFFVCVTPVQIYMLGRTAWVNLKNGMDEIQEIVWAIVNMMYFINFAINFILYFLSGSRFRKEVFSMLRCRDNQHRYLSQSRLVTIAASNISITNCDSRLSPVLDTD